MQNVPRGWINPEGKFIRTREHSKTICRKLGLKRVNTAEAGERAAHQAYAEGWISIGHGGALNAVGHKRSFEGRRSPALAKLRKLLSQSPHLTFRIEKVHGRIDAETGKHADFDLKEYDLDLFLKRGVLKKLA